MPAPSGGEKRQSGNAKTPVQYTTDDTIAAVASAPGRALRGIIRVSGPQVLECLNRCFVAANDIVAVPEGHRQPRWQDGQLKVGETWMPCRTYLWPTDRSYTGQPTAELHTIGSPPLLDLALSTVCENGARLASPGEFTYRAFLSGRIDLPQAEAVLAVIDAYDDRHLRAALAQLAGGLSKPLNELRDELVDLLAELEAGLDFVEEDIEFISAAELACRLKAIQQQSKDLIGAVDERSVDSRQFRVVLVGAPNVGKSSLLNALVARQTAIVSHRAGTTRDYVDTALELDGLICTVVDTAGVDATLGLEGPDQAAQGMTGEQIDRADLCLICLDASRPLNDMDWQIIRDLESRPNKLVVLTKVDLPRRIALVQVDGPTIETSSSTGVGLDGLRELVREKLVGDQAGSLMVASTAMRCRDSLRRNADSLTRAISLVETQSGDELVSAELRVALDELGKVVGATYTDDILDRIFGRFCIGK